VKSESTIDVDCLASDEVTPWSAQEHYDVSKVIRRLDAS
jgi:hypothetical protein